MGLKSEGQGAILADEMSVVSHFDLLDSQVCEQGSGQDDSNYCSHLDFAS